MAKPTRQDLRVAIVPGGWDNQNYRQLTDAEFDRIAKAEGYVKAIDWPDETVDQYLYERGYVRLFEPCKTCDGKPWTAEDDHAAAVYYGDCEKLEGPCPDCDGTGKRRYLFWPAKWCDTHSQPVDARLPLPGCELIDTAPTLWFGPHPEDVGLVEGGDR